MYFKIFLTSTNYVASSASDMEKGLLKYGLILLSILSSLGTRGLKYAILKRVHVCILFLFSFVPFSSELPALNKSEYFI